MDTLHRFRHGGFLVLDVLGLVQHHDREVRLFVQGNVLSEQIVTGDIHCIRFPAPRHHLLQDCFPRRRRPRHGNHRQSRRETGKLLLPVEHQRRRTHHQHGTVVSALPQGLHQCDGLQGLAKAHLVRQNAAETSRRQGPQPLVTVDLIGPQHLSLRLWNLIVRVPDGGEVPHQRPVSPVPAGGQGVVGLQQFVQIQGAVEGHLRAVENHVLRRHVQAVHQFLQGRHLLVPGQGDKFPAFQTVIPLLLPITLQQVQQFRRIHVFGKNGQVQKPAFNGHTDLELRRGPDGGAAEHLAAQHRAIPLQLRNPLRQDTIQVLLRQFLPEAVGAGIGLGEIFPQDFVNPLFLRRIPVLPGLCRLIQGVRLLLPIGRQHITDNSLPLNIHTERERRFRRQERLRLRRAGVLEVHKGAFQETGNHPVIELRQRLRPHAKPDFSGLICRL